MPPIKTFNNLNHHGVYMRILKLEKNFSENFKALSNELNKKKNFRMLQLS